MESFVLKIISRYAGVFNTSYDKDNYNTAIFWSLLLIQKHKIIDLWIEKSIPYISKKLKIQFWFLTSLYSLYISKSEFSKEINYIKNGWNINDLDLSFDQKINLINKLFLVFSLNDVIDRFLIVKEWYINELEKFFKKKIWTKQERELRKEKIEIFDSSYHLNVLENNKFIFYALVYLKSLFSLDKFNKLKIKEKEFLENFYKVSLDKFKISDLEVDDYLLSLSKKSSIADVLSKKIDIKKASLWFKEFIDILWLDIDVLTSPDYANFSANFEYIKVPTWESFSTFSLYDFVNLCVHEIETHNYCFKNTLRVSWAKFSMPDNSLRDEWLAKYNEKLLFWTSKDTILPWHNILRLFAWEEFSGFSYFKFLELVQELDWNAPWTRLRFLRYKKFYSFDLPWTLWKDLAYDIGLDWVRWYFDSIKSEKSIIAYLSLWFLRVSPDYIDLSKAYLEALLEKNWVNKNSNIEILDFFKKSKLYYRWFYVDYILYMLENEEYNEIDFRKKLKKSFDFLPDDAFDFFIKDIPRKRLDKLVWFLLENVK